MVDALDFKPRREAKVTVRNGASAEYMDLWLHWDGWTLGDTIKVHAVVMRKERVVTMGKPSCGLIRIEATVLSAQW